MPKVLPGFYIVRLGPRKADGNNLRGTFIDPNVDIRNFDIDGDYRTYYDETIWKKKIPEEIVMDFGQPPRLAVPPVKKGDLPTYDLRPEVGDILILVQGSRNPSGDGPNARRGLIGLAQVEDVYFYRDKQLPKAITNKNIIQATWTKSRCSLRAVVLITAEQFLIQPEDFKRSIYYKKSGLNEQETTLGIGSTSSSGNISSLFSEGNSSENKEKVINLLALFKQFTPTISEDLKGTTLEKYIPAEVAKLNSIPTTNLPANKILNVPPVFSKTDYYQKIYFGAPGSGKSRQLSLDTAGMKVFRTTFHPDSEYAGFVGAYKPFVVGKDITYAFVPQIFSKAYVYAWEHPRELVCLAIDEINRGNCAQTFGDLFQLLDRNETGFSEYELLADADFAGYLETSISNEVTYSAITGGIDQLKLPPNLSIYATMNTSDQSLFPMDSAFKRRWDWEYIPIDYADANQFMIVLSNDYMYKWGNFIACVNRFIVELTGSEDKQLGNRFVNPKDKIITLSMFKSKVLFYLWSEIYKNESDKTTNIFVYQPANAPDVELFTFSRLYEKQADGTPLDLEILPSFMRQLGLEPIPIS